LRAIAEAGVARNPKSAVALTVALLMLIATETVYLEDFWRKNEEGNKTNNRLEATNSQMQRHFDELRSASQKIGVVFTRLNDGIARVANTEGRLPTPGQDPKSNSSRESDPGVAQPFREYGLAVTSLPQPGRDSSVNFQVGSDHLELHRLVPLLAEEENSSAFLFVDKLDLVRPPQVPAFSMYPTGLETRLSIRVLAGPK
jgi:hypothetical protein